MSDNSEQLSRESSVSLFSGLGTSSVSGPSESGHVNVEDLNLEQLETALAETKTSLKQMILETLMFESYYERLVAGQIMMPSLEGDKIMLAYRENAHGQFFVQVSARRGRAPWPSSAQTRPRRPIPNLPRPEPRCWT